MHPSEDKRSIELLLQCDGRRVLARTEAELRDQLVVPDFFDLACRVRQRAPGFWSAAQWQQIQSMPCEPLPEFQAAEGLDPTRKAEAEFGPELSRLFATLGAKADQEARALAMRNPFGHRNDDAPQETSWWERVAARLGLGRSAFVWGGALATACALVWWSLPSSAWLSLTEMARHGAIAQYLSGMGGDVTVKVVRESGVVDAVPEHAKTRADLATETPQAEHSEAGDEGIEPTPAKPTSGHQGAHPGLRGQALVRREPKGARASTTQLEQRALAAWKRGDHRRAISLYRRVIARAPGTNRADLAWGDLFVLLRAQGSLAQRRRTWKRYLKQLPKGRFAEHASSGLCRTEQESARESCWRDYREKYPKGAFDAL